MRYAFIALFLSVWLQGADFAAIAKAFERDTYDDYKVACQKGKTIFSKGEKDEKILSLIGVACLRADYIDMLALIQSRLYTTAEGRANASLFASMLLQKRLIAQFVHDDSDISTLALPVTKHPLSTTFTAIRDGNYELISTSPRRLRFSADDVDYEVYIDTTKKNKLAIDMRFKDGEIQEHRYR